MRLADILEGGTAVGADPSDEAPLCLAYARVSTDDQERAGLSMPAQVREIEAYAQTKRL